jgi:hypothetical protein
MCKKNLTKFKCLSVFIILVLGLNSCNKEKPAQKIETKVKPDNAIITFVIGDVKLTRQGMTTNKLKTREYLIDGDLIQTGKNSHLTFQVRKDIVLMIAPESKITLKNILDPNSKELNLHYGETLSKLDKLSQGQGFSVKTPSISAGVRGTQFLTRYENNISTVSVSTGSVAVIRLKNEEENLLDQGKAIDIHEAKNKITLRNQSQKEILKLNMLNDIPLADNYETASEELQKSMADEIKANIFATLKKIESLKQETDTNKLLTMNELKAKYGRIDVIRLYSGKKILGIIISRGAIFKVLTPAGQLAIDSKEVQSTDIQK